MSNRALVASLLALKQGFKAILKFLNSSDDSGVYEVFTRYDVYNRKAYKAGIGL